jgi:hypothetical protein
MRSGNHASCCKTGYADHVSDADDATDAGDAVDKTDAADAAYIIDARDAADATDADLRILVGHPLIAHPQTHHRSGTQS